MNLDAIPIGNTPEDINVVIEVPIGGPIKYELDKTAGTLFVDRFEHYKDFEAGKWVKLVGLASVPRRF